MCERERAEVMGICLSFYLSQTFNCKKSDLQLPTMSDRIAKKSLSQLAFMSYFSTKNIKTFFKQDTFTGEVKLCKIIRLFGNTLQ